MKIFKRKHFQALIYSIFLALPLLSVLGRCVYTIVNKNAYQSYSEGQIIELRQINTANDLIQYTQYTIEYDSSLNGSNTTGIIHYTDISINWNDYTDALVDNVNGFRFYSDGSNYTTLIRLVDSNDQSVANLTNVWGVNLKGFTFTYDRITTNSNINTAYARFMHLTYLKQTLDNAFEYSIDRFVSDNDYGNFDFFQWFSSFFLSSNAINNLYIHFVNWYLNYVLYVSLGYLIFSVLFWFVNFFRRLVEDTQNINVGGM